MNGVKSSQFGLKNAYFFYSILLMCVGYLIFEYFFIPFEMLSADEFVFARHIYDYIHNIPYRDFPPYKTVLGYYLLSIPLVFSHSLLQPLFYIKTEIALINVFFIAMASYVASQLFDKKAVLFIVMAIMVSQPFLIYASDLRVDMLTTWGCLFAALTLLQHRIYLAGTLLSIAFLISQKALWYFLAMNGSLVICYLLFSSSSRDTLRSLFKFNIAFILPIIFYVVYWSCMASPMIVINHLFYDAYVQAGIEIYTPIYLTCWQIVLSHGSLLFLLWPFTFISLFETTSNSLALQRRVVIISLSSIALLLYISYKQPFPYNFVFTIPAFFLLYAEFISWVLANKDKTNTASFPSLSCLSMLGFYTFAIFVVIYVLSLPTVNYILVLLPIIAYFSLYPLNYSSPLPVICKKIGVVILLIMGIIYPLYRSIYNAYHINGRYQQTMLTLAASLLEKEDDYVAAVPFFYQKDQPIEGLKNIIEPARAYLYSPDEKLKPLLLASLYLAPTSTEKILHDFEKTNVKLIINNYRITSLPPAILRYLENNYQHFYGSIYFYAPIIDPSQLSFILKFTGSYHLETLNKKTHVEIDGKRIHPGKIIYLKKGDHITNANGKYRLALIPHLDKTSLDPAYLKDQWMSILHTIDL